MEIPKILEKLKEEKFLDDTRFAQLYVRDKFRLNQWGKIKLTYMLRKQSIVEDVITSALDQIDDETYYQTCFDLIKQKLTAMKESNLYARKAKLYRFAASRGFESDLIHRVLNQLDRG